MAILGGNPFAVYDFCCLPRTVLNQILICYNINVLYLVMGHPLAMGHYFHFVKSNKTYNNSLTIHLEKLIFELFNVLHLVIISIKKILAQ